MPRRPRLDQPGLPQHVIQRGNNRAACFFADEDYYSYLHWLKQAAAKYRVAVHAYVLMTNHVHLLATPGAPGALAALMQSLGRRYVRYVNFTYQRSGTLWEGRYKAGLVDDEAYLLRVYRYIELNPVRAGMAAHPRDYRWSSYAHNAGEKANDWLVPHPLYQALGLTAAQRVRAYAGLFSAEIDVEDTARIRAAVNLGIGVNDARFREEMVRADAAKRRGGRKKVDAAVKSLEQVDLF